MALAVAVAGPIEAQDTGRVTGVVRNELGQPIASANVVVQGTRIAGLTGEDGRYVLVEVPVGTQTVVASLIGYGDAARQVSVAAGEAAAGDLQLTIQAVLLEGIVTVGYGTQQRRTVTGSVATINADRLAEMPTFHPIKALQNRLPGVDVTNTGNKPGDGVSIRIRGVRSITAGNDPLYVVDGVPIAGGIGDFNSSDIVSIDILKDATATAIYGSRGANGVVLVTTKGAATGGVTTEFSASASYSGLSVRGLPKFMNNEQYVEMLQAAAEYDRDFRDGDDRDLQTLLGNETRYQAYLSGEQTDWQELIKRTGRQQDFQLGMRGISGNTRFNLSGTFFNETGTVVGIDYTRTTGTASVDHVHGRLRMGVTANFVRSLQVVNGGDGLWGAARTQTGFGIPYDAEGGLITFPDGDPLSYNPLRLVEGRVSENRRDRVVVPAFANLNLADGIDLRVNFGADYTNASAGNFTGADVQFGGASFRTASYDQDSNFQYTVDNLLQIDRDIGPAHHVAGTLLYGIQKSRFVLSRTSAQNIPYDEAEFYAIGQGDNFLANSGLTETALESYMGRAVYTFQNRYTIMGAVRRDGSSVLAPGNKWTTFPTAGVAWQLGDEAFMQGIGWLSSLKLRASWGRTGSSAIQAYQTQGALQSGKINFGATTGPVYFPNGNNPANPDLAWEKTAKTDAGIDFGLFANRLTGTVDVYRENTTDLLLRRSLPGTSGYLSALQNIGSTRNQGIEVQLSSVNVRDWHGLRWHMDINWAHNKNEITGLAAYSDVTACPAQAPLCDANNGWFVGFPINTGGRTNPLDSNGNFFAGGSDPQRRVWFDFQQIGVWRTGEEAEAGVYGSYPGQIRILDLNGDGVINAQDRVILGNTYPKWTAGIYNRFSYGAFDLSVLANIRSGYMIWNNFLPSLFGRRGQILTEYWTPRKHHDVNPAPNLDGQPLAFGDSRGYISGSHWRIRNIQLGYSMPAALANRFGATSARIYATATEPYVHFKYNYFDPEFGWHGGSPAYRTLQVGANVIF